MIFYRETASLILLANTEEHVELSAVDNSVYIAVDEGENGARAYTYLNRDQIEELVEFLNSILTTKS